MVVALTAAGLPREISEPARRGARRGRPRGSIPRHGRTGGGPGHGISETRVEALVAGRAPEVDLRVRQRAGRRPGSRQERPGGSRRPARHGATPGRSAGEGSLRPRDRREGGPRGRGRQGVPADLRRTPPDADRLQGRVPLPQRQHEAGPPGAGAGPLPAPETGEAVGQRPGPGGRDRRPGFARDRPVPGGRRPTGTPLGRLPSRYGSGTHRQVAPDRGPVSQAGGAAAVPRGSGAFRNRSVRPDRILPGGGPVVRGRGPRRPVSPGGAHRGSAVHEVLGGRGVVRRDPTGGDATDSSGRRSGVGSQRHHPQGLLRQHPGADPGVRGSDRVLESGFAAGGLDRRAAAGVACVRAPEPGPGRCIFSGRTDRGLGKGHAAGGGGVPAGGGSGADLAVR